MSGHRGALHRSHSVGGRSHSVGGRFPRVRGFTLIVAVFLITGLAVLGLFMVQISGAQHHTAMLAALGAQGYYASRAGAEWAVNRAVNNQSCNNTFAAGTLPGTMADYTVTVTCSSTNHTIAGDPNITVWSVTSIAVKGALGDLDHISRTLTISFFTEDT